MVKLSIVIPAYNESRHIVETLRIAFESLRRSPWSPYELIVSDDASTDDTARLAEEMGAKVVHSGKRNIGATRNVGAAAASGDYLLFVDADTHISADLLNAMQKAVEEGAVGGGACIRWSEPSQAWWADRCVALWNRISLLFCAPAGSFFFVRRDLFHQAGGFDESFFVSEELHLGRKLKRLGRLKILRETVATSPRKLHQFTLREHLLFFMSGILLPWKVLRDRKYLDIWYTRRG